MYFFVFLLLSHFSIAQLREFHITERKPDGTSVVQANTEYPDNAMILVYSDLEGLDFRSSVGGINQQRYNTRANRYEILVSPQRQILFVAARGYIEQRVALINPEPKAVFYFQVEVRKGQDKVSVVFLVEPRDAKLFIDDVPTEINKTVSVPLGTVNIRIEKEGFWSINEPLVISNEQVKHEYSMKTINPVTLKIKANVEGARVEINNQEKGLTDAGGVFSDFLLPGTYQIRLSKSGYVSDEQSVEISEQKSKEVSFTLERNMGELKIKSKQSDLTIRLNTKLQNKSVLELAPGDYLIEISKEGYRDFKQQVSITRGETTEVDVDLEPILGDLQFRVTPYDAGVTLRDSDGNVIDRWNGLKFLPGIVVGNYTVEVRANGYITQKRSLKIEEGKKTEVIVALKEKKKRSYDFEGNDYSILATYLPRKNVNGISLANSNFGLHFNYVPNNWGFYTEASSSFNFSASTLSYQDDLVFNTAFENNGPEAGEFLPNSNIQSWEVGAGVVYRKGIFSFMLGVSYFTHHFRQDFKLENAQTELVLIDGRSFQGLIPKIGAQVDIKGLIFGYSLSTYHNNDLANVIMIGISFQNKWKSKSF